MSSDEKKPVMVKRERPEFVRFAVGDVVEGVLVKANIYTNSIGAQVNRYMLEFGDAGRRLVFNGTIQLDEDLHIPEDYGHRVEIRCTGEDKSAGRSNAMKVFEVLVSKEPVRKVALPPRINPEITDDDIGF